MWEFLQQIGLPAAAFILFAYLLFDKVLPVILKNKSETPPAQVAATDPQVIAKLDELKRSLKGVHITLKELRQKVEAIERDCEALRDCHLGPTARDGTGGYKWYLRGEALDAIEDHLEKIARAMDAETEVLKSFAEQLKRLSILA